MHTVGHSRMFHLIFDHGKNKQPGFTPWGDMMNTDRYPNVDYNFEDDLNAMVFRAD